MRSYSFLLFLILLYACEEKIGPIVLSDRIIRFEDISLKDLSPYTDTIFVITSFPILYNGPIQDTISLAYNSFLKEERYQDGFCMTQDDISIHIDTTVIIPHDESIIPPPPPPPADWTNDKEWPIDSSWLDHLYRIQAHPVIFTNNAKQEICIGSNFSQNITVEALKNQKWQAISTHPRVYACGLSIFSDIIIAPEHIAITTLPVFSGKMKTRLRVKFDSKFSHESIYSNEIDAMIDPRLFDMPNYQDLRW